MYQLERPILYWFAAMIAIVALGILVMGSL
jgi:hypothetical protein